MKRLLAACLLALASAWAVADEIVITSSYTHAAGLTAAAQSTSVAAQVTAQVGAANTNYLDSGIDLQIVEKVSALEASPGAKADTASLADQWYWLRKSVSTWRARYSASPPHAGADIHIHFSDPVGLPVNQYATGIRPVTETKNSFIAMPVRGLLVDPNVAWNMELALSSVMNDTSGYATRVRLTGNIPFCMHTREAGPSDPTTPVPILPYYTSNDFAGSQAASIGASCAAFWADARLHYGSQAICPSSSNCSSYSLGSYYGGTGCNTDGSICHTGQQCELRDSTNALWGAYSIEHRTGANGPITCTGNVDVVDHRYANPSIIRTPENVALGDATHDSKTPMNAGKATIAGFDTNNGHELKAVESWLGLHFFETP